MAFEREWRDMAYVPRWSIVRVNRRQNLAEHCFYVTLYAMQIADLIEWTGPRGDLMKYALIHDVAELELGDVPGFTKAALARGSVDDMERTIIQNKFPDNFEYIDWLDKPPTWADDIVKIVKVADVMDCVMYICEEIQSGNQTVGHFDNEDPNGRNIWRTNWSNPAKGERFQSILNRNMHRLYMAWFNLPPCPLPVSVTYEFKGDLALKAGLDHLWRAMVLPRIDVSYRGTSRRVF